MAARQVAARVGVAALIFAVPRHVAAAPECTETAVEDVCHCNRYAFMVGNQCNQCKDPFKWGRGCDLECREECKDGCTLIGDCIVPDHVNCKRDNRLDNNPHQKDKVVNEVGECQHCNDGFYGKHCEHKCPINCKWSNAEGQCTRNGLCYHCEDGWWGEKCDQHCPKGCPKCTMKDDPKDPDGWKGGSCPGDCKKNYWGETCHEDCPQNCQGLLWGSSCKKEDGTCSQCAGHKFWGDKCEEKCPDRCEYGQCSKALGWCDSCNYGMYWGNTCENSCGSGCRDHVCKKTNGECEQGCDDGWWGLWKCENKCSSGCYAGECQAETGKCSWGCEDGKWSDFCNMTCPARTVGGCGHLTGLPNKCEDGYYPNMKSANFEPECKKCSELCKDGACDQEGRCSNGCVDGSWGVDHGCTSTCPSNCQGNCDPDTGKCYECKPGFTGIRCHMKCHPTCKTCVMENGGGDDKCTSCFKSTEPVDLKIKQGLLGKGGAGWCKCIENAAREDPDGSCECILPEEVHFDRDLHEGWYRRKGKELLCDVKCVAKHSEVYVGMDSHCIPNNETKWIYIQASDLKQGACKANGYEIKKGDNGHFCKEANIVDAMIHE